MAEPAPRPGLPGDLHRRDPRQDPPALRAAAVYVLMLVVIRLMGKRTVGDFTAFDLLVALMLGEIADEITYGDGLWDLGFGI
jgi:hypothetical protein